MLPRETAADFRTDTRTDRPPWMQADAGGIRIQVHLQPGARRTAIVGEYGGRLKIAIQAPPVEGRANGALVEWLAVRLGVSRRQVRIVAGARGRDKTVLVSGVEPDGAQRRLGPRKTKGGPAGPPFESA